MEKGKGPNLIKEKKKSPNGLGGLMLKYYILYILYKIYYNMFGSVSVGSMYLNRKP